MIAIQCRPSLFCKVMQFPNNSYTNYQLPITKQNSLTVIRSAIQNIKIKVKNSILKNIFLETFNIFQKFTECKLFPINKCIRKKFCVWGRRFVNQLVGRWIEQANRINVNHDLQEEKHIFLFSSQESLFPPQKIKISNSLRKNQKWSRRAEEKAVWVNFTRFNKKTPPPNWCIYPSKFTISLRWR